MYVHKTKTCFFPPSFLGLPLNEEMPSDQDVPGKRKKKKKKKKGNKYLELPCPVRTRAPDKENPGGQPVRLGI